MREDRPPWKVVKVGGSLYDVPDLRERLHGWLRALGTRYVLLVPGGGAVVDAVRDWDRHHRLGETAAHWLALRGLETSAHFLRSLLGNAEVIRRLDEAGRTVTAGKLPVLNVHAFAQTDEHRPDHLPHCWEATSDAFAARAAAFIGAEEVILLKSGAVPEGTGWEEAARAGLVDPLFPRLVAANGGALRARVVNLRAWRLPERGFVPPGPEPSPR